MTDLDWIEGFPGARTVCDLSGIVLHMNQKSVEMYRNYGGNELIGRNLIDCHPEPAKTKLLDLMHSGNRNIYTIERNGVKKLIYQAPWMQAGRRVGIMELALEIPVEMPHFVRS
jgi:hypothetical protein